MKILLDMNLSPTWVDVLRPAGHHVRHWSEIGAATASDRHVMEWAKQQGYVIFTHDLDFGAILATTEAAGPSVVQLRTQEVAPAEAKELLLAVLARFESELERGAIVSVDEDSSRVRLLPIVPRS